MDPQPYDQLTDLELMSLCCWREARGEKDLGKRGVCHVVANRVAQGHFGGSISQVILWPYQFSSFNRDDANSDKWPSEADPSWVECQQAASTVLAGDDTDITSGAVFYFSPPLTAPPHGWGNVEITIKIGNLTFCKPT